MIYLNCTMMHGLTNLKLKKRLFSGRYILSLCIYMTRESACSPSPFKQTTKVKNFLIYWYNDKTVNIQPGVHHSIMRYAMAPFICCLFIRSTN